MSKKKKKTIISPIMKVVIIQLVIALLFLGLFSASRPAEPQDIKQANIVVSDTWYIPSGRKGSPKLEIYTNDYTFVISNNNTKNYDSVSDLSKKIKTGDSLSIKFYKVSTIFDEYYCIVDAQTETEVYRSLDDYYISQNKAFTFIIVLCIIFEVIFLAGAGFYLWLFCVIELSKKRR